MTTRKSKLKDSEPTVVVGSHLTVTTWPNGKVDLKWDDEVLLSEVKNAILKYESNVPAAKQVSKKKKTKNDQQISNKF